MVVSRLSPDGAGLQTAVLLDDREEAVDREGHPDAWRAWLQIANAVTPSGFVQVTTSTRVLAETGRAAVPTGPVDVAVVAPVRSVEAEMAAAEAAEAVLPGAWAAVDMDLFLDDEITVARALAAEGVAVPEMVGEEIAGLPVTFAWPERRIAVAVDTVKKDRADLIAAGWTVLGLESGILPLIDRLKD